MVALFIWNIHSPITFYMPFVSSQSLFVCVSRKYDLDTCYEHMIKTILSRVIWVTHFKKMLVSFLFVLCWTRLWYYSWWLAIIFLMASANRYFYWTRFPTQLVSDSVIDNQVVIIAAAKLLNAISFLSLQQRKRKRKKSSYCIR